MIRAAGTAPTSWTAGFSRHLFSLLVFLLPGLLDAQSRPSTDSKPSPTESRPAGDAHDFAPLFKFLPENVESVLCLTRALLTEDMEEWMSSFRDDFRDDNMLHSKRAVHAGRKFGQRGDYEGVSVYELERPIASLNGVLNAERYTFENIGGVSCFVKNPVTGNDIDWGGPLENWITVVDRKFMIRATRRTLLKEAIAAKGPTPEAAVEKLGFRAAEMNWGSPVLIVRKYDAANRNDIFSPANAAMADRWPKPRGFHVDRTLCTFAPKERKGRLEVVTREPDKALKYFREVAGDRRGRESENDEGMGSTGKVDLVGTTAERSTFSIVIGGDDDEEESTMGLGFPLLVIFGYHPYMH
jgi:hypothetical protein